MPAAQLASQVNNKNMGKEIKCPNCPEGTLDLLNDREYNKLKELNGSDKIPEKIHGCDDCKYWIDSEDLDLI